MEAKTYKAEDALIETKGIWSATIEGDEICFRFDQSDQKRNHYWMQTECFDRQLFGQLPGEQEGEFKLEREAGSLVFKGKFENNEGLGRHTFTLSESFRSYLGQQGFQEVSENTMFSLFLLDVNKAYLAYLKQIGLMPVDTKQLGQLSHHSLPLADLKKMMTEFKALGYSSIAFNEFIDIQIHDLTPKYIKSMAQAGFKNLSIEQIKRASIHDVNPTYVLDLKSAGFKDLSLDEIIQFAIHDVDAAFVKDLNQMGFTNLTADEVRNAAIHNVNSAYVKELKSAGFENLSLREITQLAIHDVDTDFVKDLNQMGYTTLSVDEVRNAAIHDVDSKYIRSLNELGFKEIPLNKVINLRIHDVTAEFITLARKKGLDGLSLDEYRNLKIHGLDKKLAKSREE